MNDFNFIEKHTNDIYVYISLFRQFKYDIKKANIANDIVVTRLINSRVSRESEI